MDNALVVNICINDDPSIALEEAGSFLADYYNIQFSADRTRDWTVHGPPRAVSYTHLTLPTSDLV